MRTCLRGCLVGSSLVVVALAVLVAQVAREPVPYTFERGSFEQPAQAHIRLHTLAHQDYPLLAKLLIRILHPVKVCRRRLSCSSTLGSILHHCQPSPHPNNQPLPHPPPPPHPLSICSSHSLPRA